ncbi:MAG: transposase [Candidatus Cloacimonetes bacterium]|nr:transposase [Candidatus Cloacimonadota bacterium]
MQYQLYYRRKLPHYQPKHGVFFITFRLAFAIPQKYLNALNEFKTKLNHDTDPTDSEIKLKNKKKLIAFMDDAYTDCDSEISLTADPQVAMLVGDKIQSLGESMYHLYAYAIMPNHVHLVIKPKTNEDNAVSLADIMKQIKGSTARSINLLLHRTGSVWFQEYYDYWVRNQEELYRIIEYIRQNPVKAKLVENPEDWEFTYLNPELFRSSRVFSAN